MGGDVQVVHADRLAEALQVLQHQKALGSACDQWWAKIAVLHLANRAVTD
jgi:hypothetical protein